MFISTADETIIDPDGGIIKRRAVHELYGTNPTTASNVYVDQLVLVANVTLKSFAIDAAGNRSDIKSESYVIDVNAPAMYLSTLSNGSFTRNPSLNVAGTVSDNNPNDYVTVNRQVVQLKYDGSNSVSISEVQKVINGYLGL